MLNLLDNAYDSAKFDTHYRMYRILIRQASSILTRKQTSFINFNTEADRLHQFNAKADNSVQQVTRVR